MRKITMAAMTTRMPNTTATIHRSDPALTASTCDDPELTEVKTMSMK